MLKQTLLIIAITLGFTSSALAHPFHLCSGEMEFNPKTKRWEVAMKMHPSDIETAIRKKTGKKVDVAAKEGSPEIVDYLSKHFQLAVAEPTKKTEENAAENKQQEKLEFVGAEIERGWLWVYFEIPAPEGKGAVTLTHSVLLDEVEKQSNTILVRNKGKRASLHFSSDKRKVGNELLAAE